MIRLLLAVALLLAACQPIAPPPQNQQVFSHLAFFVAGMMTAIVLRWLEDRRW